MCIMQDDKDRAQYWVITVPDGFMTMSVDAAGHLTCHRIVHHTVTHRVAHQYQVLMADRVGVYAEALRGLGVGH